MIRLKNSGVIDEEIYSSKRAKHLISTSKLMGIDNIIAYENCNETIEVYENELAYIDTECVDEVGVEKYIGYKIRSDYIEIDYNDRLLDYVDNIIAIGDTVKLNGATSNSDIWTMNLEINSNFFIGAVSSEEDICKIDIHNDDKIGLYSMYFEPVENDNVGVEIAYNGENIFESEVFNYLYIFVLNGNVYVDVKSWEIDEARSQVENLSEYFTKDYEYECPADDSLMSIMYGDACWVSFYDDEIAYKVNLDKLCGRDILRKESL